MYVNAKVRNGKSTYSTQEKKNTLRKSTHRLSSYLCLLLFTRKNKNVKVLSKKKIQEEGGWWTWSLGGKLQYFATFVALIGYRSSQISLTKSTVCCPPAVLFSAG